MASGSTIESLYEEEFSHCTITFLNIFPVDNREFGRGMNFCCIPICEIFIFLEKVYDIN